MEFNHKPIMLKECIEGLRIDPNGIYVDGTLGGAGHSFEIAKRLSENGLLIGIDRDEDALKAAKERLKEFNNVMWWREGEPKFQFTQLSNPKDALMVAGHTSQGDITCDYVGRQCK